MIPEIVALCIAIPSYALFLLQLNIIRKTPKLQSTFFKLFVLRGFFVSLASANSFYFWFFFYQNIGFAVVSFLLSKLPSFGLFLGVYQLLPKFVLNSVLLIYYMYYAELLVNMFMLLHRLTAFAFVVKHNQVYKYNIVIYQVFWKIRDNVTKSATNVLQGKFFLNGRM